MGTYGHRVVMCYSKARMAEDFRALIEVTGNLYFL
jgi:hypothetical protein